MYKELVNNSKQLNIQYTIYKESYISKWINVYIFDEIEYTNYTFSMQYKVL